MWIRAAAGLLVLALGTALLGGSLRGWRPRSPLAGGRPGRRVLAGFAAGLLGTLLVHSSSLAVIALVAAADAGALPLRFAWAAVVGANVGSALLPQLLVWTPPLALVAAVGGVGGLLRLWRPARRLGRTVLGACAIYLGLELIGGAARAIPPLGSWLRAAGATAPLAYLAGVGSTALLFSSTLTLGVMQRLVAAGAVPLPAALAFALGANVGTTADVLWAALPCGGRGRATALFHWGFNLCASLLALPLVPWAARRLAPLAPAGRLLAHAHLGFNLGAALLALPVLALARPWGRASGGAAGCPPPPRKG